MALILFSKKVTTKFLTLKNFNIGLQKGEDTKQRKGKDQGTLWNTFKKNLITLAWGSETTDDREKEKIKDFHNMRKCSMDKYKCTEKHRNNLYSIYLKMYGLFPKQNQARPHSNICIITQSHLYVLSPILSFSPCMHHEFCEHVEPMTSEVFSIRHRNVISAL